MSDTDVAYLRFPHLHGDLLCFAAEDDLWVAPLSPEASRPGRAWRVTVDRTRVGHPRFSPDGTPHRVHDLAQPRPRDPSRPGRRRPRPAADLLGQRPTPGSAAGPPDPDGTHPRRLLARPAVLVLLLGLQRAHRRRPRRPAALGAGLRHRGRRRSTGSAAPCCSPASRRTSPPPGSATGAGRRAGCGCTATRLLPDLDGHLDSPDVRRRPHRLPLRPRGRRQSLLLSARRHRPAPPHRPRRLLRPARLHRRAAASSTSAPGELWLVDDLGPDAEPRRLDVRLGGPRAGRRPYQVPAASHVDVALRRHHRPGQRRRAYAAACTGSPTATAPPAPSPTPRASGCGCP